jgi:hypothetical protein
MAVCMARHRIESDHPIWPQEDLDIHDLVSALFDTTYLISENLYVFHVLFHDEDLVKWTAQASTDNGTKVAYYEIYHDGEGTMFVSMPARPSIDTKYLN